MKKSVCSLLELRVLIEPLDIINFPNVSFKLTYCTKWHIHFKNSFINKLLEVSKIKENSQGKGFLSRFKVLLNHLVERFH